MIQFHSGRSTASSRTYDVRTPAE